MPRRASNTEENAFELIKAVRDGNLDGVNRLLALGVSCDHALREAAGRGHTDCVRLLLAAGANAKCLDESNQTTLMLAARGGHADCVRLLLAAGVDPNIKERNPYDGSHVNQSPLVAAVMGGHVEVVRLLGGVVDEALVRRCGKESYASLSTAEKRLYHGGVERADEIEAVKAKERELRKTEPSPSQLFS